MGKNHEEGLHSGLLERWHKARDLWTAKYPNGPQVILTCGYRSHAEQNSLYAQGRTRPGAIVTNARGGQSLHNYGLAFDVAFARNGKLDWSHALFKEFAALAKPLGLEWGGDWKGFVDMPHFQPPNMTWQKAQAGVQPSFGGSRAEPPRVVSQLSKNPLLTKGAKGEDVRRVQTVLVELGYYEGKIDGDYGPKTFEAVRALQSDYELYPDGKVGLQTWALVEKAEKQIKDGTLQTSE